MPDGNSKLEQYGYLRSVRHQAKKTMELINAIAARFGTRILWSSDHYRNYIDTTGFMIGFRRRGNKYADWLELTSVDINLLRKIKEVFPDSFKSDVEIKQGPL